MHWLNNDVIPYPKVFEHTDKFISINSFSIYYESFDSDEKFMAEYIHSKCLEFSNISLIIKTKILADETACIKAVIDNSLKKDGYILDINQTDITIKSADSRGRFYGAVTLIKLLDKNGNLPIIHIEDYPDFEIRGILDDISRGQVSNMEHFKKTIRFCAEYKLNTYILYIEDLFAFKSNKKIGLNRGALTHEEIHELVYYAAQYQVELVPLFESLGHQENIVALSEYKELRETDDGYSFNPTDIRTINLMDSFYEELAQAFPSTNLFAGLDETDDVGKGKSKEVVLKLGIEKVYADYYNSLNKIAKKHGKNLWVYCTHAIDNPKTLDLMDKDITMVNYTFYPPKVGNEWWDNLYNYMPIIYDKGFKQIVSPSVWNFKKNFPDYEAAFENITQLNNVGLENKCVGSIVASWCDEGGDNFREYNWYGYVLQAESSWNTKGYVCKTDFSCRFGNDFYGCEDIGKAIYHLGKTEHVIDGLLYRSLWHNNVWSQKDYSDALLTLEKIKNELSEFNFYFEKGKKNIVKNLDSIPYLLYSAKRAGFACDLICFFASLNLSLSADRKNVAISLSCRLSALIDEFEILWKRTLKIEGLENNLKRYDILLNKINDITSA